MCIRDRFVIYDCPLINCINEEMKPMQLLQLIDRKYIKYVISQGEITVEDNKLTKIKELDAYKMCIRDRYDDVSLLLIYLFH